MFMICSRSFGEVRLTTFPFLRTLSLFVISSLYFPEIMLTIFPCFRHQLVRDFFLILRRSQSDHISLSPHSQEVPSTSQPFLSCYHPVYTNSLLANLNARKMIRRSSENTTSEQLGSLSFKLRQILKASPNVSFKLARFRRVDFFFLRLCRLTGSQLIYQSTSIRRNERVCH